MEEKYTNIKKRVLQIAKNKEITIEKFLKSIGMTYGSFKGKALKGTLNSDAIVEIYTKYSDINIEWLITGNGEMFKHDKHHVAYQGDIEADFLLDPPANYGGDLMANCEHTQIKLEESRRTIQLLLEQLQHNRCDLCIHKFEMKKNH
jgi:hypothetical protein